MATSPQVLAELLGDPGSRFPTPPFTEAIFVPFIEVTNKRNYLF